MKSCLLPPHVCYNVAYKKIQKSSTYALSLFSRHSDFFPLLKKIIFIYRAFEATANQSIEKQSPARRYYTQPFHRQQIMIELGWEPLYYRRPTHILRLVNECLTNRIPRYLSNYFDVRNHDIHCHKTRNNNDFILKNVNLECTKRAFFYKGAINNS